MHFCSVVSKLALYFASKTDINVGTLVKSLTVNNMAGKQYRVNVQDLYLKLFLQIFR